MEDNKFNFSMVKLARVDIPVASENIKSRGEYVPFSINSNDDFFEIVTESYNTSTTNAACVEGLSDLIFGKGLFSENENYTEILERLIDQEDVRRIIFDIKLYGSSAVQVYWDDSHTKIIKLYHTPVQNIRAEKIGEIPRIQNYYYCTDWTDMKSLKNKTKIPSFGTSNEKMELLYIKSYTPGMYYYSIPDWFSSLQLTFVEAELNNLHFNNVSNGFFPSMMMQFNNGVPSKEERDQIESSINSKFGGTKNAGKFMITFNNSKEDSVELTPINIDNLHDKFAYVAEYAQDRILVSHRIISPLLFGVRTKNNGFSSNANELSNAFSILQSMTINPFQNLIINTLNSVLKKGGYPDFQLYFEQLTPTIIVATQAEQTDQTVEEVKDDINKNNTVDKK